MMLWRWWQSKLSREAGPMDDIQFKGKLLVRTRSVGHLLSDTSDLESPLGMPSTPFADMTSQSEHVSDETWDIVKHGSGIQQLVEQCPEDVIAVLKHHAVVKLGTVQASDSAVLKAFGNKAMLTRGCDFLEDSVWEERWTEEIKQRAHNQGRNLAVGWEEMVTLGAYAVKIKNIAARDQGAILKLLLQKYSSGATSKKIWEYPAVRAVINYHWEHWARKFLMASAIFFMAWLLSFAMYLIVYIDSHELSKNGIGKKKSVSRVMSYVLNALSFSFMCPFAMVEIWTIVKQKRRWIQARNILDLFTIVLQAVIFFCHQTTWCIAEDWFAAVLALQCVCLFAKLQDYGRVLGAGASFSEIFTSVMFEVRFLLVYTVLTGVSAALCLGVLYKHDDTFLETSHMGTHFQSFKNSLVTTFQIIFGSFDSAYIFEANYPWVKIIFFFGFQILMSITILNLFIAVMTESYTKFAAEQRIRYNRGRANVIEDLDVLGIPDLFSGAFKPYIHFLVVEKKTPTPQRPSLAASLENTEELKKKVDKLAERIEMLVDLVARTSDQDVTFNFAGPSTN